MYTETHGSEVKSAQLAEGLLRLLELVVGPPALAAIGVDDAPMNRANVGRLVFLLLAVSACAVRGCETVDLAYGTFDDAVAAEAVGNLWIPPVLPPSATAIEARYDIDAGETWVRFRYGADLSSMVAALDRVREDEQVRMPRTTGIDWWPRALSGPGLAKRPSNYEVYRYERVFTSGAGPLKANGFVAVDPRSDVAYCWQSGRIRLR